MKKLLALLLLIGIVGCETPSNVVYEEQYSKYKSFAAVSIAPGMSLELNPNCFQGTGCEYDLRFYCDSEDSIENAKSCAISKCQKFYDVKNNQRWKSKDNLSCLAYDLGEGSYVSLNPYFYARLRLDENDDDKNVRDYKNALQKNNKNYINDVEFARSEKLKDKIRKAQARREQQERKKEQLARLEKINREAKIEAEKAQREAELARFQAFLNGKKNTCRAYGFTEENAIAKCVQTEINNEITRFQQQMQQQQAYANAQARANAARRNNAFSNMGRCLSAEASFAACSNAWNGYTPKPAKKVYKCDYDVFGNQISSTCREQ